MSVEQNEQQKDEFVVTIVRQIEADGKGIQKLREEMRERTTFK